MAFLNRRQESLLDQPRKPKFIITFVMESSEAIESSDKTLGMLVIMLLSPSNNNNKNTKSI